MPFLKGNKPEREKEEEYPFFDNIPNRTGDNSPRWIYNIGKAQLREGRSSFRVPFLGSNVPFWLILFPSAYGVLAPRKSIGRFGSLSAFFYRSKIEKETGPRRRA